MNGSIARKLTRFKGAATLLGAMAVFAVANMIIQAAINSLGTVVMAASTAAFTIEINIYVLLIAFGRMTWPHIMARAMLAEQLWRATSILANHPYHREG